ncbi:hypothetical protein C2E23DRAFT_243918 [Lenzites betulinus]|nr:hypothetical protein C2E23DRAFT_243918 [Lenzites betulinus]
MSGKPPLNDDILVEVLHHIQRQSDVARMMRTCKILWQSGAKALLAHGVVVTNPPSLGSFCTFMLSNIAARAPHLRQFHFDMPFVLKKWLWGSDWSKVRDEDEKYEYMPLYEDEDEDEMHSLTFLPRAFAGMLAQVLHKTVNLQDLTIVSCERLITLDNNAKFSEAIIALRHLRRFRMESVGVATAEVLKAMASPLVELHLGYFWDGCIPSAGLFSLAEHHASTLEKLSAEDFSLDKKVTTTFPRVRALALRDCSIEGITVLHEAFPGLRSLEVSGTTARYYDNGRARGLERTQPWGELDRLCGDTDSLYVLGRCPRAQTLEVTVCRFEPWEGRCHRLDTVISETRPTRLVLRHWSDRAFPVRHISHGLLPLEGSMQITHLVLSLEPTHLQGTADEFMSALTELLRRQSFKFLMVRLRYEDPTDGEESEGEGDTGRYEIVKALSHPREDVLRQLFEASPALADVVLNVAGKGYNLWTLHAETGRLQLQPLERAAGRALARGEDIVLKRDL